MFIQKDKTEKSVQTMKHSAVEMFTSFSLLKTNKTSQQFFMRGLIVFGGKWKFWAYTGRIFAANQTL